MTAEGETDINDVVEMLKKIPTPLLLWFLSIAQPNSDDKPFQWSATNQLSADDLRKMSKHIINTYGGNI